MEMIFEHQGRRFSGRANECRSIAIELDFHGPQPIYFDAPPAKSEPFITGEFTGRTASGGSCNVDSIEFVPHCNGTHTETMGHIVNESVWIGLAVRDPFMLAALITVNPVSAIQTNETYRPALRDSDQVITASEIQRALGHLSIEHPQALILRTTPNLPEKRSRVYSADLMTPFFTVEAMQTIVGLEVSHLLVDLPSVDRMQDEGRLTNHHLFWNVAEGTYRLTEGSRQDKTITELIYVGDEIVDGVYGLNLQVPAFCCDAAPSRPIIWPVEVGS